MKLRHRLLPLGLAALFVGGAKADLTFYYDFTSGVTNAGTGGNGTAGTINSGSLVNATPAPAGSGGQYYTNSASGDASSGTGINTGITVDTVGIQGGGAYTAMAWVKFNTSAGDNMVFGNNGGNALHLGARDAAYHFGHWGADTTVGTIDTTGWHHVTWKFEPGVGQSILVDGYTLQNTPNNVGGLNNSGFNLIIGSSQNGGGLEGNLDDVAVFNSALNIAQVKAISSGAILPNSPSLNSIVVAAPSAVTIDPAQFTVQTALSGTQLNNLNDALTALSGVVTTTNNVPAVNFWQSGGGGGTGNFAGDVPFPGVGEVGDINDFATRATTILNVAADGYYVFGINGDDGGRIRIDGSDVVVDNALHGGEDRVGAVFLTAGQHPLEHIFFERGGGAESELFMVDANGARTLLNTVVPEPGVIALAGLSLLGLRRRRR